MTGPGPTPEEAVPSPPVSWGSRSHVDILADWITQNRGSFTEAALERTAISAGYTSEDFATALRLGEVRARDRSLLAPIKSTARWGVLAAYGIVWLFFAVIYLGRSTSYGAGQIAQFILTIALGIGLAISLLVIWRGRPDPERRSRAMALLLAVPVILLVGVAGLCLPFTRMA